MAIAYVQPKGIYGGSVASITTVAITTTSGNLLHADSSCYSGQANNFVITDSKSNTWANAVAKHLNSASANYMQSDYAKNITGGSSHTFTQALGGSGIAALSVIEISGADTTAPLGLHETGDITSATQFPGMTTTGSASSGDIAVVAISNDTDAETITEASGWTTAYDSFNNGATQLHTAVKVLTGTGTVSYSATATTSNAKWAVQTTTYKPASGGGGTSYTLTAAQGSFSESGQAATIKCGRVLSAAQGSFSLSGKTATLMCGRAIGASQGSFSLSGKTATLSTARKLTAAQGSFSLSGQAASFISGKRIVAAQGSFALSGKTAGFKIAAKLGVLPGQFSLSGQDAAFHSSGQSPWTPVTPDTQAWSPSPSDTQIWTPQGAGSSTWTPQ